MKNSGWDVKWRETTIPTRNLIQIRIWVFTKLPNWASRATPGPFRDIKPKKITILKVHNNFGYLYSPW